MTTSILHPELEVYRGAGKTYKLRARVTAQQVSAVSARASLATRSEPRDFTAQVRGQRGRREPWAAAARRGGKRTEMQQGSQPAKQVSTDRPPRDPMQLAGWADCPRLRGRK